MELIEHLGGTADPAAPASASQLAALLRRELTRGLAQTPGPRAGYDRPLVLAALPLPGTLAALVPVDARFRTDIDALDGQPRAQLLVASALEALIVATDHGPMLPGGLAARFGDVGGALLITMPWLRSTGPSDADAELAALQWEDRLAGADRLRVVAVGVPADVTVLVAGGVETATSIGHHHPLDRLEVLLRAGLAPHAAVDAVDRPDAMQAASLARMLGSQKADVRPHEDADPARRIARRMLQMLRGKRKWSGGTGAGYHTEITHLTRGFEQRERDLAGEVVDALLETGLLVEKLSVGQRHVSLLSRRAADIDALIDDGVIPPDLRLPRGRA